MYELDTAGNGSERPHGTDEEDMPSLQLGSAKKEDLRSIGCPDQELASNHELDSMLQV